MGLTAHTSLILHSLSLWMEDGKKRKQIKTRKLFLFFEVSSPPTKEPPSPVLQNLRRSLNPPMLKTFHGRQIAPHHQQPKKSSLNTLPLNLIDHSLRFPFILFRIKTMTSIPPSSIETCHNPNHTSNLHNHGNTTSLSVF